MHRYLFGIKRNFRHIEALYYRMLRHNKAKFIRFLGILAILLAPAAAISWWYYGSSTALNSAFHQSANEATPNEKSSEMINPSKVHIDAESTQKTDQAAGSSESPVEADVQINGQRVNVPPSGEVHKEIINENGKTSVDISIDSVSSGSSSEQSSMNIEVNSSTESNSEDL